MAQHLEIGESVQPLTNAAILSELVARLENRRFGLQGMGVLNGPAGYGKTFAATFCAASQDIIHISVGRTWTQKIFLQQLLKMLGKMPKGTIADMALQAEESLALDGRTLIVDETDYAIENGWVELLRDLHDKSDAPLIMIGMEDLPQKLMKWPQIHSRVRSWAQAQPCDMQDARMLALLYAPEVEIADDLLEIIVNRNTGNARLISADLDQVQETATLQNATSMNAQDWGDMPFSRGDAPSPRRGLKV